MSNFPPPPLNGPASETWARQSPSTEQLLQRVEKLSGGTIMDVTDGSGGSADGTLVAVDVSFGATYSKAEQDAAGLVIANNFADLAAKLNELLAALRTAELIQ